MEPPDDDVLRVLLQQKQRAEALGAQHAKQGNDADAAIASTEALLRQLGVAAPERRATASPSAPLARCPKLRPWAELVAEARASTPERLSLEDLLTAEEIRSVAERHSALDREFAQLHQPDTFDWAICGVAGVLGALVDIFLVQVPRHPGFLGGQASEGGWLSNLIKDRIGQVLPEEQIRKLENAYRVPYDVATSRGLSEVVPGLGPGTHRYQSLGHDPLLGWIFGVRDLLRGEFTAIGSDGRWIVQVTGEPLQAGEHLFVRIFEALRVVAGHLLSDLGTPRGLPAPLMPLLLFLQHGSIGKQGYTVAEISRQMYRMNYDFRHFLASSVPVLVIEVIVRIAYFAKAISEGKSLADAVPLGSTPKLRTQLFTAHAVATAANAGKVYVTQNPLAVSWPQWLAFFRYLLPQAHWLLVDAEKERARHVSAHLETAWEQLDTDNVRLWKAVLGDTEPAVL